MAEAAGTPFDPVALAAIRKMLSGLDDLQRGRVKASQAVPDKGSLAAADAAFPDARFVGIHAFQAISVALDHLLVWRLVVHGPIVPYAAHLTLLRAALEGAIRARWLLDCTIDSRTRVARGWAARRDDQVERDKFETSTEGDDDEEPHEPVSGKTARERLEELEAARLATLHHKDPTAGIPRVGFTDTTALMIASGHERWYRLASAAAHGGKEWGLAAAVLTRSPDPTSSPGVGHGTVSASEDVAVALTSVVLRAVRYAVADAEAYVRPAAEHPCSGSNDWQQRRRKPPTEGGRSGRRARRNRTRADIRNRPERDLKSAGGNPVRVRISPPAPSLAATRQQRVADNGV